MLLPSRFRGWPATENDRLQPTESGQRFLNDLITLFLPEKEGAA